MAVSVVHACGDSGYDPDQPWHRLYVSVDHACGTQLVTILMRRVGQALFQLTMLVALVITLTRTWREFVSVDPACANVYNPDHNVAGFVSVYHACGNGNNPDQDMADLYHFSLPCWWQFFFFNNRLVRTW